MNKIILISFISVCFLFIVEHLLQANYTIRTLLKITVFVGVPLYYYKGLPPFLKNIKKENLLQAFGFGLAGIVVVGIAYLIFRPLIDWAGIGNDLEGRLGITALNFLFIGLYIIFVNSFIEEFFFRGFIFLSISSRWVAYVYSSLLFAVYHISIFQSWFAVWIMGIVLLGLFIGGLLFNWLNEKQKTILNSWVSHAMIDVAIIVIAFIEIF